MQAKGKNNHSTPYNDENQEIDETTWPDAGENMMIVDYTSIDPTYHEQKLAERLVLADIKKARKGYKKITPLCPFAKKEFDTKPEYGDILRK